MPFNVELRELRCFLALADELHFGRTAERLGVSQSTVSAAIRLLEHRIGAKLFDRTSRRVSLTATGAELQQRLTPIVDSLDRTLRDVREHDGEPAGLARIGTTYTTFLPPVLALIAMFTETYPACAVNFLSIDTFDPYTSLRRGEVDVLINWLAVDEPDLTVGPAIAYYERVLAVRKDHPLASRASVSVEELADELVTQPPPSYPAALSDAIVPARTPSGQAIRRVRMADDTPDGGWALGGVLAAVARGELVHPTMRDVPAVQHPDLTFVTIHDLPLAPLGLIWCTASEDEKIRALAKVARLGGPWPTNADEPASR